MALVKSANASLLSGGLRETLVWWDCTSSSRVTLAWVIQAAPSATGPWVTVNGAPAPADISCAFVNVGTQDESAQYRVAAVDYWQRQGAWSTVTGASPWPRFR